MSARVSIIMGIYNCESTLPEAIDSILSQTFSDWKLIMCDDGSSDGTAAVAHRYQQEYPEKIVLVNNPQNMGLNYTLNQCLKYADTEYVARMDGDDISLPTRLEKEIVFLDTQPEYAIVSTPMLYFDEHGVFMQGKGGKEPTLTDYAKGTPYCHAPCMVRKEAYDSVGGYSVSVNCLRVEDWDLWVRMRAKGYRGYCLDEPLYMMRDDRNAFSRRKLKYRINEARVIAMAVQKLKLPVVYYLRMFRPIIVGMLPQSAYKYFRALKSSLR